MQHGKASFGNVYAGKKQGEPVAIKVFHLRYLPNHLAGEFDTYNQVSHPNILAFYGICDQPGKFSMVTALMPFNLARFYNENELSMENIYNFAEQIAQGLSYLHSKEIAHKHLKSTNIFIDNDLTIKISDFGLSKIKIESAGRGGASEGATVRWRAPETFTREYFRIKDTFKAQSAADVYSYGLLLWEMKARKKPFATHSEASVVQLLSAAQREEIDNKWPQHFKDLLTECWAFVPGSRPLIDAIITKLHGPEFNIQEAKKAPFANFASQGKDTSLLESEVAKYKQENANLKMQLERAALQTQTVLRAAKRDEQIMDEWRSKLKLQAQEIEQLKMLVVQLNAQITILQCKPVVSEENAEEIKVECTEVIIATDPA